MRRLFLLAALCMVLAVVFAPGALAQSASSTAAPGAEGNPCGGFVPGSAEAEECYDEILGQTVPASAAPFPGPTSASADPCPNPDFPRQTPDGCQASDLPDVIGGGTPVSTAGADEDSVTATAEADEESATATASADDEVEALPETGGVSAALMLAPAALLLVGGLVALRVVRRV